jgi:hypothetical protein
MYWRQLILSVTNRVPKRCEKMFILSNVAVEWNLSGTEINFRVEKINLIADFPT